jgi:hypothetical protein
VGDTQIREIFLYIYIFLHTARTGAACRVRVGAARARGGRAGRAATERRDGASQQGGLGVPKCAALWTGTGSHRRRKDQASCKLRI